MKLPRNLSGTRLADHLIRRWSYTKVHQVGSHSSCKQTNRVHTESQFPRTTRSELEH